MYEEIVPLFKEVLERQRKGHPMYYKPFDPNQQLQLRTFYKSHLKLPVEPIWMQDQNGKVNYTKFFTRNGTWIGYGYTRIVIGDYGAYIEFEKSNIDITKITPKFKQKDNSREYKYNWLETKDASKTKIYEQLGTVSYADYRVGYYYVNPAEVFDENGQSFSSINEWIDKVYAPLRNMTILTLKNQEDKDLIYYSLSLRKNIIETGDPYHSAADAEKFTKEYREKNNIQIRALSTEQMEMIIRINEIMKMLLGG